MAKEMTTEERKEMTKEDYKEMVSKIFEFLEKRASQLDEKEKRWEELEARVKEFVITLSQRIILNIGGTRFEISKKVLFSIEGSMFSAITTGTWKADSDGSYFIDRSPHLFPVILDYLRTGSINLKKFGMLESASKDLMDEMDFYLVAPPTPGFEESTLLDKLQRKLVADWVGWGKASLLYKATRDGFASLVFHAKCDNKGPTLMVIRSTGGYIFGGYTSQSWDSSGVYKIAPGSFLFTITNPNSIPPTKYLLTNESHANAIYCGQGYGPTFGGGHDLHISNNSNGSNCSVAFPSSYRDTIGHGAATFTGSGSFLVADIEIYLKH